MVAVTASLPSRRYYRPRRSNKSAAQEAGCAQINVFLEIFWPSMKVDKVFRYRLDLLRNRGITFGVYATTVRKA